MHIGGFVPFTTLDYPGELAAVIFCQGCGWRCTYCHNPHLQPLRGEHEEPWEDIESRLEKRKNVLDAVIFSGGEPLLQKDLKATIQKVKKQGYKVGLHTSGQYPEKLENILPDLNWIGLDIKATPQKYDATTQRKNSHTKAMKSLDLILKSGLPFEARTTVDPRLITIEEVITLAKELSQKGVTHYALQEYRPITQNKDEPNKEECMRFFSSPQLKTTLAHLFAHVDYRYH